MTPMPPEIPRTLAAYRMIMGKVQILLAQQRIDLPPLSAMAIALIGDSKMTAREAIRLGCIPGSNPYQTVNKLHKAGYVRCSDAGLGHRLTVELTPLGKELATALREALGGQETGGTLEAAE